MELKLLLLHEDSIAKIILLKDSHLPVRKTEKSEEQIENYRMKDENSRKLTTNEMHTRCLLRAIHLDFRVPIATSSISSNLNQVN